MFHSLVVSDQPLFESTSAAIEEGKDDMLALTEQASYA
jgi:hypothetical protein